MNSARRGLVLLNLGTPEAPTTEKVRKYLDEFLMDGHVIDIPYLFRWLLVKGVILRKRPALSAEAYKKIWTDRGSPLLYHLEDLTRGVRATLEAGEPGRWEVVPAMRYGQPSIENAIRALKGKGVDDTLVFPLYPQYSLAATKSSEVEARAVVSRVAPSMKLEFVPAFYEAPPFIGAFAEVARKALEGFDFDHLLFSFHGLPERQVKRTDPTGSHCQAFGPCCDRIVEANRDCYRAQCYATARALSSALGLPDGKHSVSFQSRLGRTPWIKPYTDELYAELPKRGVRKLAVMCPAFVSDCLETLEEISIRGKEDFIRQGGEDLRLIPSLNSEPGWIRAVSELARSAP